MIQFLTLRHRPDRPGTDEYRSLDSWLGEEPVGSFRPPFEQRAYRRESVDGLTGVLRFGDGDCPVEIEDLSGTGMRLRTPSGSTLGATRGHRTISLTPPTSRLRIDVPVEFVHSDGDSHGVRFAGPPLVLRRHPPTKRKGRVTFPDAPAANDEQYLQAA